MSVVLPDCPTPELSVVMVAHGAWELTERALRGVAAHTTCPFEVIVVDNASPDETPARLAELRNARVIRNRENRGFGPASNQGAEIARAEHLLLLNTDAFVHAGWLEPLLQRLREEGVGAVVPRYLNADGSLQEAGTLLARDGTIWVYGEGEDPRSAFFRFPRAIDSASAACVLMRTDTFVALGGFDDAFAPAYYEDTDFYQRLGQTGQAIMYEPRSSVTHVRYGSGDRERAARLSERNRGRFVERWRAHLAGRPGTFLTASSQAVFAARDALATPRVLLSGRFSEPAEVLAYALLARFPRARITWAITPSPDGVAALDRLLQRGVEAIVAADVSWLRSRLFLYDLVLLGEGSNEDLQTALAQTQPQADRIHVADLAVFDGSPSSDWGSLLADRGIAAPGSSAGLRQHQRGPGEAH